MEGIKEPIETIVERILERTGKNPDRVIPILQEVQQVFHYLPDEALQMVCDKTGITPSEITGISTFFNQFRHRPAGKHTISVCTGTACHVKGATQVYDALHRVLKLSGDEDTDQRGLFTLEKVACLGCCTIAPVVRIDSMTYGHVNPEKVDEMLEDFLGKQNLMTPTTKEGIPLDPDLAEGEIRIGLGSCCIASGSQDVKEELERVLQDARINAMVKQVGCVGICHQVPVLEIVKPGETPAYYTHVRPEEVKPVVLEHFKPSGWRQRIRTHVSGFFEQILRDGAPTETRHYKGDDTHSPVSGFLGPQVHIATENRGVLRPTDLDAYRASGGLEAITRCINERNPQQVIDEIKTSNLRGRGGAGFPTGEKWQLVRDQQATDKVVICNGDEGDPGAFMDRMILESYPFRVLEGMLVAGYATGASSGILYIRAEYPLAVIRIREAIAKLEQAGYLGENILDSSFGFHIEVFEGAGAFVCGEETALIASLEGKRGIPRLRPPYPSESGYHGKPTLVNNTETFSLISWILRHGADAFSAIGTSKSAGSKVFALAGKVNRGGLIEVPMGMSIRQIVEEIGGGIAGGKALKAVQIGGPSGGCIPADLTHLPVDFEALKEAGAMMGSGGLVVLDETDCMVDIAHYFLAFTQSQSCGQCTFCRVGTTRMLEILEKIRHGKGTTKDLELLEQLAQSTKEGSLCGLGKSAPNPVLSTLNYFREEYEAHLNGICPAKKCLPLIRYTINDQCIGCTKCAQRCPSGAIPYTPYDQHAIDQDLCIKCGICYQVCPEDAINILSP
jgi:NADH-quinone oxidoreductase subunit F